MASMKIVSESVVIRFTPSFNGLDGGFLYLGNTIDVDLATRTEAEGHVWVKHVRGWSPERSTDGKIVFLEDESTVQPEPELQPEPIETVTEPAVVETTTNPFMMATSEMAAAKVDEDNILEARVRLKVRIEPSLKGKELVDKAINPGKTVMVDLDSQVEVDGFVWIKHDFGWSALKQVGSSEAWLVKPGTPINTGSPDVNMLPGLKTMIQRMPVALGQTTFFQYFGNSVFAFTDGKRFNYDGYSQGLHGGLDFANRASGIPIYAGVECYFVETKRRSPNLQIWTRQGDYTLIYQHITKPKSFSPGEKITPDTIIAEIEPPPGPFHLHFEIRYKDDWIVNPLLFMSDEMIASIVDQFKPDTAGSYPSKLKYFYQDDSWEKWLTPMDQPIIKRRGALIGPKSR